MSDYSRKDQIVMGRRLVTGKICAVNIYDYRKSRGLRTDWRPRTVGALVRGVREIKQGSK